MGILEAATAFQALPGVRRPSKFPAWEAVCVLGHCGGCFDLQRVQITRREWGKRAGPTGSVNSCGLRNLANHLAAHGMEGERQAQPAKPL